MTENRQPRVSVVMAVYNGGPFLNAAVRSVLEQTFADFEFIIIDDSSTDDTPAMLTAFANHDSRIKVLRNRYNLGQSESLNRGIFAARGDYIARQDADDISAPDRLARQVAFLDAYPHIALVATLTEWIDEHGKVFRVWIQPTENPDIQVSMLSYCCLIHGSVVVRRRCIDKVGGFDPSIRVANDHDLWLRLMDFEDVACVPAPLYAYRWHGHMISTVQKNLGNQESIKARQRAIQRRVSLGWQALHEGRSRFDGMERRQIAERFRWWSAGAHAGHWSQRPSAKDRWAALELWLISVLLANPVRKS